MLCSCRRRYNGTPGKGACATWLYRGYRCSASALHRKEVGHGRQRKVAQVDATGAVFHGDFQQNPDGTQSFIAQVDGQTGTIDSSGNFYVQSGPQAFHEEIPAGGGPR